MSGKRAKQLRKSCRKVWDEDNHYKSFYGEDGFRRFYKEVKHNYSRQKGI